MTKKRPASIQELKASMKGFATREGVERGLAFKPRASDILISPYVKCGTTWTQQIVHGLRTRGAMDFDEITAVTPWLELSHDMGIDPDAQTYFPRAYKSHLSWDLIPKGGKYICVIRDPKDALISMYKFFEGWFFTTGSISITEFAREHYLVRPDPEGYWYHLRSWWTVRERPDVLLLCYENMREDLVTSVRRIATFMDIELDADLEDIVLRQSSIEFMRAHGTQFDDHLIRMARDSACGLPPGGDASKVRSGRVGDHVTALEPAVLAQLDEIWSERIGSRFGLSSYADLRERLRRMQ